MKKASIIFCLFVALLLIQDRRGVLAAETAFITQPMSDEIVENYLENVHIVFMSVEPQKRSIQCFDVNENGLIAIGTSDSMEKWVCVYDADGVYQYGYKCESYGSICVEWDGDVLGICFVRSDVVVKVTSDGKIVSVLKITDCNENSEHWREIDRKYKIINGRKYAIQNDMGILNYVASSYSQVQITEANGETRIIYDVNTDQRIKTIINLTLITLWFSGTIAYLTHYIIKTQKNGRITQ